MNDPAAALEAFLWALGLGACCGVWGCFLDPLRGHHRHLSDLLWLTGIICAWGYLSFGVCLGDMRLALTLALLAAAFGFYLVPGRLLRPVFSLLWRPFFIICKEISWVCQKILLFFGHCAKKNICISQKLRYNRGVKNPPIRGSKEATPWL